MAEKLTSGLVVVGAGGAGLPAALAAQERGIRDVVVLEKRPVVGGNAGMSGGFLFAVNSGPQRRAGLRNSADEVFRGTISYYHYDGVDPRLVRQWVDQADATVDWLEREFGVGYRHIPHSDLVVEPSGWSNHPGSFKRVMDLLAERVVASGGSVRTRTPATGVAAVGPGEYLVTAAGPNGPIEITTPRIVLASGGFTGNVELLHAEFPGVYDESIYWTDAKRLAGDGIEFARRLGGDVSGRTFLIKENGYSFKTKKNKPNRAAGDSPLWVNRHGVRFADESVGPVNAITNALIAQPGMSGYALFDDALVQAAMDRFASFGNVEEGEGELRPGEDDPNTWTSEGFRRTLRDELSDPANDEWCVRADSWDEIARWIGADPEVLSVTVAEYNRYCAQGHDELWAKPADSLTPVLEPPFYALRFRPLMVDTSGPVRVDEQLRALDADGQPIPGVFVAGVLASGWIGNDEHRFGTPLAWAMGSGLTTGHLAAAYEPAVAAARR